MAYLDKVVSSSLIKFDNTPHFLMELSQDEFATLEHCCIHITDIGFSKSTYSSQNKIHTAIQSIGMGKGIEYNQNANICKLNMDRSQHNTVLITVNKEECFKCLSLPLWRNVLSKMFMVFT